ncbi:MFS transporter [Actinoplanes ianthinogenes]|uniref:MFS transporter n=1 Tax=Actinoplanes ianthinogenes TaxID=122358 RepID=A0ABN6CK76_9ACTN|nr:MFS transporter [Actinoplanes ianthinogenes]BCJ45389.1 MFS transporter [Actinoplanes ianthinogenes]GGR54152.1 MFS transporter [Actinoplanes ianthinogenes]
MTPSRGATLTVLCTVALMIVLDSTIVAVAIPAIQRDLGFTPAGVAWVVNGYLVAFAGFLLLAGRLGDLLGARRVFLAGLSVFTAASLLCGLAPTAGLLVAGRFVQGVGGALASAVVLGMIVRLYPEPGPQARAMGIFSFTQAGGAAIGFVAGGVLTDLAGWPAIFLINVPIGLAAWLAGRRLLPAPAAGARSAAGQAVTRRIDLLGAALITAGLSLGVYAIVTVGEPSPPAPAWLLAAGSVLLISAFLVRQGRAPEPLVPLRLLRRPWLLAANAAVILILAAGMGFQFVNTLFLQRVMGLDTLRTGLAFLPTPIVIGLVSLVVAARLTARFGPRRVLLTGLLLLAIGLSLLVRVPADPSYLIDVLTPLIIMGLGVGVTVPAIMMLAMAGASDEDTGLVSGLINTAQQAGAALGLAVLAAVAASRTSARTSAGLPETPALRDGYSLAFLTAAAFVVAALLIVLTALRHPPAPAAATEPPLQQAPDEPSLQRPSSDQPSLQQPAPDQLSLQRSSSDQLSLQQPATDQLSLQHPAPDQLSLQRSSSDQLSLQQPATDEPSLQPSDSRPPSPVVCAGER